MSTRSRTRTGVEKAIAFVLFQIETGQFAPGESLPPVRKLCGFAGVSEATMWKALSDLKKQGVLTGDRGCRIRVKPVPQPASSPAIPSPLTQRQEALAEEIRHDIYTGVFRPGDRIPAVKELIQRYRTSSRNLRAALETLHRERLIRHRKRGFEVPQVSVGDTSASVVVLVHEDYLKRQLFNIPQGHDFFRDIEPIGSQKRLRVRVVSYRFRAGQLEVDEPGRVFGTDQQSGLPAMGYIFLCDFGRGNRDIVSRIAQQNCPLAVLTHEIDIDFPASFVNSPLLRVFPVGASPRPGEIAATFLAGMGHRKIGFFSTYHDSTWSKQRLVGLQRAYRKAGFPDAVRVFAVPTPDWGPEVPPKPADGLPGSEGVLPLPLTVEEETEQIYRLVREQHELTRHIQAPLHALLEQALADPSITAWVTANDTVAERALSFLHQKHIPVPGRLSLLSFDDSLTAIVYRITSYNFAMQAITHAAFNHILQARAPLRRRGSRVCEVDGIVVERETTAPVGSRE